jgi:Uma2 family endonuclease
MNVHQPTRMTIPQFDAWAQGQQRKHELVRGVPHLQPNVKLNHNRIVANISRELASQLDAANFEFAMGDFAVQTGPDSVRFADVMIFPAGKSGSIQSIDDAWYVFEVLSKSSMHDDFGDKRHEYQALASLKAYVVLAQDEPQVWLWRRGEDGQWPADPEQLTGGAFKLEAVGVELAIGELYRGVKP